MSKCLIELSLNQMFMIKHAVKNNIAAKQEKLLKLKNNIEKSKLNKDIEDENKLFKKVIEEIEIFKERYRI